MKQETRAARDAAAMAELAEWFKPLSLTIDDNGCEIFLRLNGAPITKTCYHRPWRENSYRSKAAACKELTQYISKGGWLSSYGRRKLENPDGSVFFDERTYQFMIPACSSPSELAIKLAAKGWRPPSIDIWDNMV